MGKCYNSIVVKAPIDKVWAKVRNFHDLSWAEGVIEKCEAVGSLKGDEVGNKRVLNGVFHETLKELSDDKHRIQYKVEDGPPPLDKDGVTNFIGMLTLREITADSSTFAEWISRYQSPDDAKVAEFCNPIYTALLAALQKSFA